MARSPLDLVIRWPLKVAEEILLAPWTIAGIRRSLAELPGKVDELNARLKAVGHLDTQVDRLAHDMNDLSEAILKLMGSIPGVRRALRPTGRS